MTAPAPPLTLTPRFFWFLAGLLAFGVIGVAGYILSGLAGPGAGGLLAAFVMLAVTAAPAVWALRAGRIALGSGILAGYALATVLSAGQCTLWAASLDYGFLNGFAFYLIALIGTLVVSLVVAAGEYLTKRGRSQ